MGPLLVELLDEAGRDIDDLDDGFALTTARLDLEVTHSGITRASTCTICCLDQLEYHFIKVCFHGADSCQRIDV